MDLSFVAQLYERGPREILHSLVRHANEDSPRTGIYPFVTIPTSVQIFSGIPVRIIEQRGESLLVLFGPERGIDRQDSLAFVPLQQVTSLTIDNFRHALPALADAVPQQLGEAPSKLALQRRLAQLATSSALPMSLEEGSLTSDVGRSYLTVLLDACERVVPVVTSDAMGKEALAAISGIELRFASDATVAVAKHELKLVVTIGSKQRVATVDSDLRVALEAAL